jgi:small subunit ribosomal protein S11
MPKKDKVEEKVEKKTVAEEVAAEKEQKEETPVKAKKEKTTDEKPDQKTEKPEKDETKTSVTTPKKQSFKKRHVSHGKAFVVCSYNNTVITITDLNGNVLGWASSGALGFKGPKKSTPFAATLVAQKAVEKTARYGLKEVDVLIKGVGGGREASVRALGNAGWMIHSIKDVTPVPHNGCRSKKPRRV